MKVTLDIYCFVSDYHGHDNSVLVLLPVDQASPVHCHSSKETKRYQNTAQRVHVQTCQARIKECQGLWMERECKSKAKLKKDVMWWWLLHCTTMMMCVVWCFLCGFHIVSCRHINKTEWTTTVCKLLQYDYICVITALCNSGPGRHNRLLSPLRFQACCKLKRGVCAFYCCNILHYSLSHKELLSFYSVTTTTMKIPAVALHFGVGATLSIGIAFALSSVYEVMMVWWQWWFVGVIVWCCCGVSRDEATCISNIACALWWFLL